MSTPNQTEDQWPKNGGGRPAESILDGFEAVLWRHRIPIVVTVFAAAGIALAVSFFMPSKYTVTASFAPVQAQTGQLSLGLASMAGQLGTVPSASNDSPEFYSRLLRSQSLLRDVVVTPIAGGTLFDYFGLTAGQDSVSTVTRKLARIYSVSVDRLPGIVRIHVTMKDARLAKEVAEIMLRKVDGFNSDIRRNHAREKAKFLGDQLSAASVELDRSERDMEGFLLRNAALNSPKLAYEKTKFERRIQVAQELFVGLSRQLQTASLEELDNTPAISVVEAPFLPDRPSSPRRALMMVVAAIGSGALACLMVLVQGHHRRAKGAAGASL